MVQTAARRRLTQRYSGSATPMAPGLQSNSPSGMRSGSRRATRRKARAPRNTRPSGSTPCIASARDSVDSPGRAASGPKPEMGRNRTHRSQFSLRSQRTQVRQNPHRSSNHNSQGPQLTAERIGTPFRPRVKRSGTGRAAGDGQAGRAVTDSRSSSPRANGGGVWEGRVTRGPELSGEWKGRGRARGRVRSAG